MPFGLGPSRSTALASKTDERDQRCVRSVSASHHSVDEHSYLVHSRVIVTDSSSGVYLMGCCPRGPETYTLHGVRDRFGGSLADRGGVFFPEPGFIRVTTASDRASDTPVATAARYRGALFRGRADRFGGAAKTASADPS